MSAGIVWQLRKQLLNCYFASLECPFKGSRGNRLPKSFETLQRIHCANKLHGVTCECTPTASEVNTLLKWDKAVSYWTANPRPHVISPTSSDSTTSRKSVKKKENRTNRLQQSFKWHSAIEVTLEKLKLLHVTTTGFSTPWLPSPNHPTHPQPTPQLHESPHILTPLFSTQ